MTRVLFSAFLSLALPALAGQAPLDLPSARAGRRASEHAKELFDLRLEVMRLQAELDKAERDARDAAEALELRVRRLELRGRGW